jgi:hypothetical protein
MTLMAGFAFHAEDFEPNAWGARPQDYFHGFSLHGQCTKCREVVEIVLFECA